MGVSSGARNLTEYLLVSLHTFSSKGQQAPSNSCISMFNIAGWSGCAFSAVRQINAVDPPSLQICRVGEHNPDPQSASFLVSLPGFSHPGQISAAVCCPPL